eukprot:CAMPEP_0114538156 /NCGR_PEP_ID=MMETSP0109-20121206/29981_1 /TAXON_ID=29199 /ORGANISM="Chlorarachnion reptans, Strain CCCM449" /LENGTH=1190 /DNA_ID=CAMNT_0001722133 /DNA_START=107 /DNA_END=3679 /DNA_ORIENTATION=+
MHETRNASSGGTANEGDSQATKQTSGKQAQTSGREVTGKQIPGKQASAKSFSKKSSGGSNSSSKRQEKQGCRGCGQDRPKKCQYSRCSKCCAEFLNGPPCDGHTKSRAKAKKKRQLQESRGKSKKNSPEESKREAALEPLPPGWTEYKTEDGTPYFYHPDYETTWYRPTAEAVRNAVVVHEKENGGHHENGTTEDQAVPNGQEQQQRYDDGSHDNGAAYKNGMPGNHHDKKMEDFRIRQDHPPNQPNGHAKINGGGDVASKGRKPEKVPDRWARLKDPEPAPAPRRVEKAPSNRSDFSFREQSNSSKSRWSRLKEEPPKTRRKDREQNLHETSAGYNDDARKLFSPNEEPTNPRWQSLKEMRESKHDGFHPCDNPVDSKKRIPGLRINEFLPKTLELVAANPIVGIVAPTGTGKTAGVPPCLSLAFRTPIWVTVPTRSATKIWEWVSKHYPELKFGMAANSQKTYRRDTDVVYMTTGHMYLKLLNILRKLRSKQKKILEEGGENAAEKAKNIPKPSTLPGILMVDETHHPSTENYALLKLLKYMRKEFPKTVPKLVVSSATFGVEAFVRDFPIAKMMKIPVISHEVTIEYLPRPISQKKQLLGAAADAAHSIASNLLRRGKNGVVLVFCSGKAEVEMVCEFAEGRCRGRVSILPLYSNLPTEEIDEALAEVKGVRIVVATNLAESSITIPNTVAVVSTMFHKEVQLGLNERQLLKEVKISQASADQQKGRTGRTCPGHCFRMVTEREFAALPKFDSSEIHRSDAYRVVLDFVSSGFSPKEIAAILELPIERIETAVARLCSLGMIGSEEKKDKSGKDYYVTELGEFVSAFPVIPELGCVIYYAPNDPGMLRLLLICVAYAEIASGASFFWFPRREFEQTPKDYELMKRDIKNELHEKFRGQSDLSSYVRIHEYCESEVAERMRSSTGFLPKRKAYVDWANENYMNNKTLHSSRVLFRNLIRNCEDLGMRVAEDLPEQIPPEWWDDIHFLFTRSFSHCLLRLEGKKYYTVETEISKREGPVHVGKRDSMTFIQGTPKRVIALHLIAYETAGSNRQIFAGGILLPQYPDNPDLREDLEYLLDSKHTGLMHAFGKIEDTRSSSRRATGKGGGGGGGGSANKVYCTECGGDRPAACPHERCAQCCSRFSNGRCRAHKKSKTQKNKNKKKNRGNRGGNRGGNSKPRTEQWRTGWD